MFKFVAQNGHQYLNSSKQILPPLRGGRGNVRCRQAEERGWGFDWKEGGSRRGPEATAFHHLREINSRRHREQHSDGEAQERNRIRLR